MQTMNTRVEKRQFYTVPGSDIRVGDDRVRPDGRAIMVIAVSPILIGTRGRYVNVSTADGVTEQCWFTFTYRIGR